MGTPDLADLHGALKCMVVARHVGHDLALVGLVGIQNICKPMRKDDASFPLGESQNNHYIKESHIYFCPSFLLEWKIS